MSWLKDMKIFTKLMVLVAVSAIFLGVVGFTGYRYMSFMRAQADELYKDNLLPVMWLNTMRYDFRGVEAAIWQLILAADRAEEQKQLAEIDRLAKEFNELLTKYEQTAMAKEQKDKVDRLKAMLLDYRTERQKAIDLAVPARRPRPIPSSRAPPPRSRLRPNSCASWPLWRSRTPPKWTRKSEWRSPTRLR